MTPNAESGLGGVPSSGRAGEDRPIAEPVGQTAKPLAHNADYGDREPQPSDGPDYHTDHAFWEMRQASHNADYEGSRFWGALGHDLGDPEFAEAFRAWLRRLVPNCTLPYGHGGPCVIAPHNGRSEA